MKIKITKDRHDSEWHNGPLFPDADERVCAYQDETSHISISFTAWPPARGDGVRNHEMPDPIYSHYELILERHTGKAISAKLIGHRKDTVEQRKKNGFAVTQDILTQSISFAQLCNAIFGKGCMVFHEREAYPDSVK